MTTEFYFTPELRLKDGRVIRDIEDALGFAREQEQARFMPNAAGTQRE